MLRLGFHTLVWEQVCLSNVVPLCHMGMSTSLDAMYLCPQPYEDLECHFPAKRCGNTAAHVTDCPQLYLRFVFAFRELLLVFIGLRCAPIRYLGNTIAIASHSRSPMTVVAATEHDAPRLCMGCTVSFYSLPGQVSRKHPLGWTGSPGS